MRGFPGKIRSLGWSEANTGLDAQPHPALKALWCGQSRDESLGWSGRVLLHGVVQASPFNPALSFFAAEDGRVCLWHKANGAGSRWCSDGFSCLASQGQQLAGGSKRRIAGLVKIYAGEQDLSSLG